MSRLLLGALYDPWDLPSSGPQGDDDDEDESPVTLHVTTVVTLPIGWVSYPRCVADVFTTDTLTITPLDRHDPLATWDPGTWIDAITYDARGYPMATYRSTTATPQPTGAR